MPNDQKPDQPIPENNALNATHRHVARQYALQAIYQWQLAGAPMDAIEAEFIRFQISKNIDLDYFKELIHGVNENCKTIDKIISNFIVRPIDEIDPIELGMLRLATYELLHRPDVPYRVIINEALKLTKKFGGSDGHKFVNGVLDKIAKNCRQTEIAMSKKDRDQGL